MADAAEGIAFNIMTNRYVCGREPRLIATINRSALKVSNTTPPEAVRLPAQTRGKRPHFFDDPAIDKMMTFLVELTTEVAVLRERCDTVEQLLNAHGSVTRDAIENFQPSAEVDAARNSWRDAYLKRVFRMHPAG
jgi:hypothetical protein